MDVYQSPNLITPQLYIPSLFNAALVSSQLPLQTGYQVLFADSIFLARKLDSLPFPYRRYISEIVVR